MKTLTLNTNDVAGRFDMDAETANRFFVAVEQTAIEQGLNVERVEALRVDEASECFTNKCFENWLA